jgi:hypothetical protein
MIAHRNATTASKLLAKAAKMVRVFMKTVAFASREPPQGLKARSSAARSARLKPRPFKETA